MQKYAYKISGKERRQMKKDLRKLKALRDEQPRMEDLYSTYGYENNAAEKYEIFINKVKEEIGEREVLLKEKVKI